MGLVVKTRVLILCLDVRKTHPIMKRETKGLLKERFIMNEEKDLGKAVAETFVIGAAAVILTPYILRTTGVILDCAIMLGQGATNVVKGQIDKRKKVKVEEVEED